MPEMYLRHPNGRLFYMLKTFTVKQIDFMRREILRQFKQGHYGKGTKNLVAFTGFWLLANGVADASKEALVGMFGGGADFDIADNAVENMLQLVVWSRYMGAQTMREGPGGAAMDFLFPPTNYIDNVFLGVTQGDLPKALEPVPIVGKLIYKAARKQEKRAGQLRRRGAVGSRDRFRSKVR
jgi:hypothetical protein